MVDKRKIIGLLVLMFAILSVATNLTACELFNNKNDSNKKITWNEISSLTELLAMKSENSYKLTADINLGGREWTPLEVANFDGDGHTISNGYVGRSGEMVTFLSEVASVKNLTISDFEYFLTESCSKGSLVVGKAEQVSNVHVKNCKFKSYMHISLAGITYQAEDVTDCSVEDLDVSGNVDFAGIVFENIIYEVHAVSEIINCTLNNCVINCDGLGGIVYVQTSSDLKISNCAISECEIEASGNVGLVLLSSNSNLGGMTVEQCFVSNNNVFSTNSEKAFIAGVVAKESRDSNVEINDCLVQGNTFKCNQKAESNIAGVCTQNIGRIRNCLVINNNFDAVKGISATLCTQSSGAILFCGAYENVNQSEGEFYPLSAPQIVMINCFVTNADSSLDTLAEEDQRLQKDVWLDPDNIRSKLTLNTDVWQLVNGQLPKLKNFA